MICGYAVDGKIHACGTSERIVGRYRVISRWKVRSHVMGWYWWEAIRATINGVEYWARYNADNGSFVTLRPVK